jgi:CDP-glycerol glycerophosphotransferase
MGIKRYLKRFRGLVSKIRDMERLGLKFAEIYLPPWLGYPFSKAISPFFRLGAKSAQACRLPLDQNMIIYESYNGRDFAGNPYALFLYLLNNPDYSHLTHVLVVPDKNHPKVKAFKKNSRVILVRPNTGRYVKLAQTSAYFINNSSWKPYLVKREGQKYLYTWHSTLLKKLAVDKGSPWEARNVNRALITADYFISPNRYTTDILLKSHGVDGFIDGTIAEFGYPRNDLTVHGDIPSIRKKLGLSEGEKLVLFAPTWRGEQFARNTVGETMEWQKQLQDSLPTGFKVLVKFHTMVYPFLDTGSLKLSVSPDIDTNEVLAASDILVTDYSGIFFDFLITGNPVIFFTPDRDEYEKVKKGFYLDLDTLPGPVCSSIGEVTRFIEKIDDLKDQYKESYSDFSKRFMSEDDGSACERTVALLFQNTNADPRIYKKERNRRRVLFFPGPMNPNGVTTSFISLLSSFDFNKYEAAVLIPYDEKNREFQMRLDRRAGIFYPGAPDGFTYKEYRTHTSFIRKGLIKDIKTLLIAYRRNMGRVFGTIRFDIVVNYHGYQPADALKGAQGVNAERRVIYLHNDLERDRKIKQPQLHSVFSTYHFYDNLFCVSRDSLEANRKGMAAYVRKVFGHNLIGKMGYARNFIEPDTIRQRSLANMGPECPLPDKKKCNFITIGRLSPEKNHKRLFEAFSMVLDKHPDSFLYVVGDGFLASELHRLAETMKINDSIAFVPFTPNPFPLLAACDCFVLSSDIEGQPITILEALTLNKPIIATDIAGPHDLLFEGYGTLVAPDPKALSKAMSDFIQQGKIMNLRKFDSETYIKEVHREFERKVLEGTL